MKLIAVTWTDTVGHPDNDVWMTCDEAKELKPVDMTSIGYLLVERDDFIVIASTKSVDDDDDCFGNVNAIPRPCVKAVVALCDLQKCDNDIEAYFGEKM